MGSDNSLRQSSTSGLTPALLHGLDGSKQDGNKKEGEEEHDIGIHLACTTINLRASRKWMDGNYICATLLWRFLLFIDCDSCHPIYGASICYVRE